MRMRSFCLRLGGLGTIPFANPLPSLTAYRTALVPCGFCSKYQNNRSNIFKQIMLVLFEKTNGLGAISFGSPPLRALPTSSDFVQFFCAVTHKFWKLTKMPQFCLRTQLCLKNILVMNAIFNHLSTTIYLWQNNKRSWSTVSGGRRLLWKFCLAIIWVHGHLPEYAPVFNVHSFRVGYNFRLESPFFDTVQHAWHPLPWNHGRPLRKNRIMQGHGNGI